MTKTKTGSVKPIFIEKKKKKQQQNLEELQPQCEEERCQEAGGRFRVQSAPVTAQNPGGGRLWVDVGPGGL